MKFEKLLTINVESTALDKEYWARIDAVSGKRVSLPKDSPNIKKEIKDADALLTGFGTQITKEILSAAPKLKYIGVLATAYDFVDFSFAKEKGLTVTNVPGYSTEAVAELTIGMILDTIRELEKAKIRARSGDYTFDNYSASEIKGKVFGVFGLGNIGRRVAELAQGFDADVRYYSRNRKPDAEKKGIKYEEADKLIPQCDFLSLNLALRADTTKFLSAARIKKLKKGAVVVNTAPMGLVDVDALEARLAQNDIFFMFDHSDDTPADQMKRLSKYKNCVAYPPIGFITPEARVEKEKIFVGNIEGFLKGTPTNKVN
ncbi:MAG TPA: D-isomer specific 2-hydroxyacid dehydrogenase family protein [Candidatus Acidoferrum sp.]|nr:D-isomer specific 2-hydroxyacid dehydrogenase family protein [Candidatus Acidoferrum sp.]